MNTTDIQNITALSAQMLTQDKAQAYELVGMLKMSAFTKKLVTVTEIKLLAEIKESKQYKGLTIYRPNNQDKESVTVTTFKDFCESLGMSYEKVNLDIQNLNTLGEDFLETSQRIGLGYRDLRKLRKLSEDERDLIINGESIKTQNKEELIELIEERALVHAKEKESLQKQLDDAKKDNEAQERVIAGKNKKIDELSVTTEKEKLKLESRTEEEAALEKFSNTWGEGVGGIRAGIYQASQTANQAIAEKHLPRTFLQKMLLDVCEARDLLLEMIDLLPDSAEPVDTSWLGNEETTENSV